MKKTERTSTGRISEGGRGRVLGAVSLTLLAFIAGCSAATDDTSSAEPAASTADALDLAVGPLVAPRTVDAPFTVTGLAHKCVDFGGEAYQAVGTPVILYGCNGTVAQKVRVVEIANGKHDVSLRAGTRFCIGVRGGVAAGRALELQTCNAASAAQRFALDGDTIFVGTQPDGEPVKRDLVIEVQRGRGANHTPLVVGTRELDDAEDFRFTAMSFGGISPTSGFTRVYTLADLDRALAASTWGSVIEVAPGANIVIDDTNERGLGAGVTLRGNRRGVVDGPQINRHNTNEGTFLRINGNDARITGLRLRGPDITTDDDAPLVTGVLASQSFRVTVDHNEMSAWTGAAVSAQGDFDGDPECTFDPPPAQNVRVIKNYIHQNARKDSGYGVVSSDGANPYVDGNTFDHNRHAVAADNNGHTNYTATYNLVTAGNTYCSVWPICWKEQDFDVHGSLDGSHYQGGRAGGTFFITNNSFYSEGKNIDVRGTPCNTVTITGNVFIEDQDTAIENATEIPVRVQIAGNAFSAPRGATVVGDFDGDGVQDEFMGTGVAWYYRPGRTKEWRFLNRASERAGQVTFGDFDGDGRTDVRAVNTSDGVTETSWGGSSPWDRPLILHLPPGGPVGPVGVLP